jgi:hypothetical protein
MGTEVFEDWLYLADMYTGVWWYKTFLVLYYLVASFVVRFIWRRTRTVPMPTARRNIWLLLAAATVAPCVVALGAGIVAPFPLGAYFYVGFAIDGYLRAAVAESLVGVAVLLAVWALLAGYSALSNKSLERTRGR